jgi:protein-tyrosine phosphatase
MKTELHWLQGPWTGRLAIMPRPRGGDWLEDEIRSWARSGVNAVVSLLTSDEIADLDLNDEGSLCEANGIPFFSFPIPDRGVPASKEPVANLGAKLIELLSLEKNIAIHCRQGIGRAALIAICLLIMAGIDPGTAIDQVSKARGCAVPETAQQRRWIIDFATQMMALPIK